MTFDLYSATVKSSAGKVTCIHLELKDLITS